MNRKWKIVFGSFVAYYLANNAIFLVREKQFEKEIQTLKWEKDLAHAVIADLSPHVDKEIKDQIQTELDFAQIVINNR